MSLIIDQQIRYFNQNQNKNISEQCEHEQKCLSELKDIIKDDLGLEEFLEFFTDPFLLAFVKGKKLNVELAHKTLNSYINIRQHRYSYLFKTLLPSTTTSLGKGIIQILRNRDSLNRIVLINRMGVWNTKEVSQPDTLRHFSLLMDDFMRSGYHDSEGLVAIFDLTGYNLEHAKVLTPTQGLNLFNLVWKNVPIRFKALHITNEMFLFSMLLKAVKPFLPKKVRDRIHVHSNNLGSLHQHLSPEILPLNLGGILKDEEAFDNDVEPRILAMEDYYEKFARKL